MKRNERMNEWMNEWIIPFLQAPLLPIKESCILTELFILSYNLRGRILPGMGFTQGFISYVIRAFDLIHSKHDVLSKKGKDKIISKLSISTSTLILKLNNFKSDFLILLETIRIRQIKIV